MPEKTRKPKTLKKTLAEIRSRQAAGDLCPALMTHVVLGYPSLQESIDTVITMADSGASIIELQIPFSDPLADGPTIMYANERALENGVTPKACMEAAKILSQKVKVPLLFMSYFNIVFRYGLEAFCRDAKDAGIQGTIVPDVPLDDSIEHYWAQTKKHQLFPIPLAAPTCSDERLRVLGKHCQKSFVYCVSTTSTTGAKSELPKELPEYLARVRSIINAPIAVGFGISTSGHIKALSGLADIAIVGSASIDLIRKSETPQRQEAVERYIKSLTKIQ